MRKIAVAVALFALTAVQAAHAHEIYSTVGTEGVGLGYGYSLSKSTDVRADFNFFRLSHSGTSGDLMYSGTAQLAHAGVYADWFPLSSVSGLRLTVGVLVGNDNVQAQFSPPGGVISVDGYSVSTNGKTIHAKASLPKVSPYLGIGYGHNSAKKGFSFIADAGIAFGKASVTFDVPSELREADPTYASEQEAKWQRMADRLRFYPIVKLGMTYSF
ncbi:hypothetical protein WJ96_06365 [Burkholderia ubonensis]|uniref:Outer membrane protein beta-barrel domain-containing protein n=1 Tax=Burkholderia ubonensis TaxID=101571 RepID=A0AAW3MW80_9BURK|nr:hypothetical protein [Burkholderia ubonensis]KVP98193.1 hypothetical protein WJ96_06365 [Burkholderia ubonensis]KVZ92891.1 hypothetical protein WL25_18030 [Burkholderia ubonensis]